jgi:hypothetical protein
MNLSSIDKTGLWKKATTAIIAAVSFIIAIAK